MRKQHWPTSIVFVVGLSGLFLAPQALKAQERADSRPEGTIIAYLEIKHVDCFLLSPEVVTDKNGDLRLAHSVLVTHETGAADYRQTETLSARVHARQVFDLDDIDVDHADLFFFGTAKQMCVNGHPVELEPLVSTGWQHARVPAAFLKKGANEIVFSGGGSLLIEPGRPGQSSRSDDGGETWSNRDLGGDRHLQGEYLVRLRLPRYSPHGWAMSPVFDLWWWQTETEVGRPWKTVCFNGLERLNKGQPKGTSLLAWLRTGSTPTPDERNWTAWKKLDRDMRPDANTSGHRWAQLKFDFATTRAQATPRLRKIEWLVDGTPSAGRSGQRRSSQISLPGKRKTAVAETFSSVPTISPVSFVYQSPSPRLNLLREKYALDRVIAPGKTEMEQLMLLRYWVRNQCHRGWASHPALWIPPWDSLQILESRDRPDCLVMCTHYSCIFTQCCLALGWNARHCILDHHCVSEVWVDQHRKWVMMDTGNSAERADVGLHFERDGMPLSARELQLTHRDGKTDGVRVCFTPARLAEKIAPLCRPAPTPKVKPSVRPDSIPLVELKNYPVCQLDNYRRYAFPPRNNYLETLYPGELEHGFSNYFYDGYCWVGDSPDDPRISPEYSRHLSPDKAHDVDWELNTVRIYLSQTENAGELQVDVASHVPNLARLEKRTGGSGITDNARWEPASARFVWMLKPGVNTMEVRGVNHWERAGRPSRVCVEWKPGK